MEVFSMTDIERIEEYFTNIKSQYGEYHTVDYCDIDMRDIHSCLHQFEGQETNDVIYVATDSVYRSIGFLYTEIDVYIAMTTLVIDKKLIELFHASKTDYGLYQIIFANNGVTYIANEYINFALNTNFTDRDRIFDMILYRCMRYHKNVPTFEKLLDKHGDVNIITKLLDDRSYDNKLVYTGEYRMLMLRWLNEHSVKEKFEL